MSCLVCGSQKSVCKNKDGKDLCLNHDSKRAIQILKANYIKMQLERDFYIQEENKIKEIFNQYLSNEIDEKQLEQLL